MLLAGSGLWLSCATTSRASGREVSLVVPAQPHVDGAGVRLRRALGSRALPSLDPFLLLDEIRSDDPNDYVAGFPQHPHRGFETVSYLIEGAIEHRDTLGNHGHLAPGAAQWMTAGHGIVHSEMPQQERGLMWAYQLWVNLPRARKLIAPRYQDLAPGRIPELDVDGARVRLVAGEVNGQQGPVQGIDVRPLFLDVTLRPGARLTQATPRGHTAFVQVISGSAGIGGARREVREGELAVLSDGASLSLEGLTGGGRLLLLAGQPWNEPIARGGPFVMNTNAELEQAWADYRAGHLLDG